MANNFLIVLITLILSAFFSGMEIAFVAANKLRIELEKNQGQFSSRFISVFARNPAQYIATMLVGNNIALVIYGIVMAFIMEPFLQKHVTNSAVTILFIQTICSTIIILITAEFLPKTIFRVNPNIALNVFSLPVMFFYIIFYPITYCTIFLSNTVLHRFLKIKINKQPEEREKVVFGKIDLDHLVSESKQENTDHNEIDHEIRIFQNALDFSSVKLRECMVPRTEIVALEVNKPIEELKQLFIETGLSKIIIYEDSIDNIIGYFHSSELFHHPTNLRSHLITPPIVPETMTANKLMRKLIQQRKSMAVVVDEFGGTSGIVTIEDIMEEIFGEIEDEHDTNEYYEKQVGDNKFILSGRLEIDYLNEKYAINIPVSDDYETIAGFILFYHHNLPETSQLIKINGFSFKIMKVTDTRIELVELAIDD